MSENLPKISIIIPSFNSEATIERAVRSALGQTYENIEVAAVDDGSEDTTPEILAKLSAEDERLRVFLKPREGVSAARNDGIKSIEGEWFLTLDADDWYEPGAVSALYDAARRTEADLVMTGFRTVSEGGTRKSFSVSENYTDEKGDFISNVFPELYDKHLIQTHSNKIYRTFLCWEKEIYYNEYLAVHEDIDFVLRYMKEAGNIGVLKGVYLNYSQHGKGESLINTFRPYGIAGAVTVLRDCGELFSDIYTVNKTISGMNLRLFWHIMAYVGIMYRESGYPDERLYLELKELSVKEDFRKLLKDLDSPDPKTFMAKVLLRLKLTGIYHRIAKLFYRTKRVSGAYGSRDVYTELARIPYYMLSILEKPGEEWEVSVTQKASGEKAAEEAGEPGSSDIQKDPEQGDISSFSEIVPGDDIDAGLIEGELDLDIVKEALEEERAVNQPENL